MTPPNTKPVLMKAWICKGYGGPEVLALEDRPVPVPGDDEVLVKIHATTVASGDVRALQAVRAQSSACNPTMPGW